jgi:type II secretory pathway pseudopilin PulG
MNTTKKIITLAVILGLAVLSFILFGGQMNKNTASSTASSAISSVMSKMSEVMIKDNKTIELAPKDLANWAVNENKIDATTVIPTDYTGINGSKQYNNPPAGDGQKYYLDIANSSQATSELSKTELAKFKTMLTSKGDIAGVNGGFFGMGSIFRKPEFGGAYAKKFIKDIEFAKPSNYDNLRVVVTQDGQSNPLFPTINIYGSRGNDYFLLTDLARDIKPLELFTASQTECNNDNANNCYDVKYQEKVNAIFTNEFIQTRVSQALATIN